MFAYYGLLFLDLSAGEIFVILLAVLMLFGSKNIPNLARGMGKAMRDVRNASQNIQSEILRSADEVEKQVVADKPVSQPVASPEEKTPFTIAPGEGALPRSSNVYSTPDSLNRIKPGSNPGGNDAGNQSDGNGNQDSKDNV